MKGTWATPSGATQVEIHYQVTPKGLTRELGYVGNYGEIISWVMLLYETVTRAGGVEDSVLRDHFVKMVKARAPFRHPSVDMDGNQMFRLETITGWRDNHLPGEDTYAQRIDWDGHPLMAAAVLQEPEITGYAQKMMEDNQFFVDLSFPILEVNWPRIGLNALRLVQRDYPAFQALPQTTARLPMSWDAPDFVFSDEVNGMVALKRGQEILYVNLYWRARQAVNNFARVHHITPTTERSGTIRQQSQVESTGTWTVRDWIMWDFAINAPGDIPIPPGGWPPPGSPELHQAFAGETQPIGHWPADVPDPAIGVHSEGVETLFVGKADFYRCEYGRYLLAMNTTADKTYTLDARLFGPAVDLVTGTAYRAGAAELQVPPMTTVVLCRTTYAFTGFLQPVDNPPTVNVAKAGSAIPVKFRLGGNQGLCVIAAGYPKVETVSCTSGSTDDIEQTVTAGGSGLSYDATTGTYTYVWKTDKSWAGSCRQLTVRLADRTDHVAYFTFAR